MDCATAREAISAILDQEEPGVDAADLERHLAACPGCRRWQEAAHVVTRQARLEAARLTTRPPAEVAAAVAASMGRDRRGRLSSITTVRLSLVAVAVVQLGVTIPLLVLGHDHTAPAHVAHEMGSFDLAVAGGFLVAAWHPSRAAGIRTVIGMACALLLVTAAIDLATHRTDLGDEAPHVVAVGGWLLLYLLAKWWPSTDGPRTQQSTAPRPARLGVAGRLHAINPERADPLPPVAGSPEWTELPCRRGTG
jgi:predicted anti-sigma-YlaC factor YlaD